MAIAQSDADSVQFGIESAHTDTDTFKPDNQHINIRSDANGLYNANRWPRANHFV